MDDTGVFRRRVATRGKAETFNRRYATIISCGNRHGGLKPAATITPSLYDEQAVSRPKPREHAFGKLPQIPLQTLTCTADSLSPLTRCSLLATLQSMAKTATTRYDVAEHLRTPEEMAAYLEACLEEADGDAAFIAKALGDIARAKGMAQVARDAGLSRESLYKALSGDRSPGFDTVLKVIAALGLKLHAEANHS